MRSHRPPRVAFILEHALGHVTHAENLERLVAPDERIDAEFAHIPFAPDPRFRWVPGSGNWTVRSGIRARRAVRAIRRDGPIDAMFVHTMVPAMLMPDRVRRTPTVLSLDATPAQYDALGDYYDHRVGNERIEGLKHRVHREAFTHAAKVVAWSTWARNDLIERYGVSPENIVVIAPGVDLERWSTPERRVEGGPVRVLFVGGDFVRKGGAVLVDAVKRRRAAGSAVELDLVTGAQVDTDPGIRVHSGLTPNSPALMQLFRDADIFCLPTFADCLAIVLSEAGAMGLPLVSTDVGAIGELVRDGETGLIVPTGDVEALSIALDRLVADPLLRHRYGEQARQLVHDRFDAATNAGRIVELLVDAAQS